MSDRLGRRARLSAATTVLALGGLLATLSTASASSHSRLYFHGPRSAAVVALTFDDGWNPSNCARVDRILQANDVAATFFPSAKWVRRAPSLWKQLAARYPFGDHTTDHPHMRGLSFSRQYDEIDTDRRIVERITGVALIRVFRAPYGELDSTTLAAAAAAGFPVTMEWDVNVYDVTNASDAKLLAQATAGHNGSVITMHCGADGTVRILPGVIDYYRSHGFRFVTVPELLSNAMPVSGAMPVAAAPTESAPTATPALAAASSSPAGAAPVAGPPATPGAPKVNADLLGSFHLLVVLTIAGAALLLVLQRPRGGARRGAAGGLAGGPRT